MQVLQEPKNNRRYHNDRLNHTKLGKNARE